MTRFNTKYGAVVLVGLAAVCMLLSFAKSHSASSKSPADLTASQTSLAVWQACALLVRETDNVLVVDLRARPHFDAYHLPGSLHLEASDAREVADAANGKGHVLLVADQEKDALRLATECVRLGNRHIHVLKGGAQAWYLAFELPVPLFSDEPPPDCSCKAMAVVRDWLHDHDSHAPRDVLAALSELSRSGYQPSLLELRAPLVPASSAGNKVAEQFRWMDQ